MHDLVIGAGARPRRRAAMGAVVAMAAVASAGVAGCKSDASTAIDVTVDSEAALMLEKIALTATAKGKDPLNQELPASPNPSRLTITPTGLADDSVVTLEVRGLKGGSAVVTARGRVAVENGQRVAITFHLRADCVNKSCAADQTCDQGACVPIPDPARPDGGSDAVAGRGGTGGGVGGTGGTGNSGGTGGVGGTGGSVATAGTGGAGGTAGTVGVGGMAGTAVGGPGGLGGSGRGGATAGTGGGAGTGGSAGTGGRAGTGGGAGTSGSAGTGGSTGTGGTGGCGANMKTCTTGTTTICIAASGCCVTADCTGVCQTCSTAHTCTAATNVDDPNGRCTGTCDGSGACKSKRGQNCQATTGGCISGTTCQADGFCCAGNCGTDPTCGGTCAGRSDGLCQYPTGACGTARCSGTGIIDPGTCSSGTCMTPTARACANNLVCSNDACKTSCTTAADCVSTTSYYCAAGACTAKKSNMSVCSAAQECSSNICGGRCCASACTCTQPNASANLLQNPGFDTNVSGWSTDSGTTVMWGSGDAENCPYSGIARVNGPGDGVSRFWQCVPISAATSYNFGYRAHADGTSFIHCAVEVYPTAGCTNFTTLTIDENTWLNVDWSPDLSSTFMSSPDARSAKFYCYAEAAGGFALDMLYLSRAPAKY